MRRSCVHHLVLVAEQGQVCLRGSAEVPMKCGPHGGWSAESGRRPICSMGTVVASSSSRARSMRASASHVMGGVLVSLRKRRIRVRRDIWRVLRGRRRTRASQGCQASIRAEEQVQLRSLRGGIAPQDSRPTSELPFWLSLTVLARLPSSEGPRPILALPSHLQQGSKYTGVR
jgi:hypothetical protein